MVKDDNAKENIYLPVQTRQTIKRKNPNLEVLK